MKHIISLIIVFFSFCYLNGQQEFSIVNLNNQPVHLEQTWMKSLEQVDNQVFYTSIQKISQNNYNLTLNAIDSLGLTVWEQPIVIDNCSSFNEISQSVIVKSSDNNIIVFWVKENYLYTQKYDVFGNTLWVNHVIVKNSTSQVQKLFSYSDSLGGAYVLWGEYSDGLFVSRVSQNGIVTFSMNGVFIASDYIRYRMIICQDFAILSTGNYYGVTNFYKINVNGTLQQLSFQYDNSFDTPFDIISLNDGFVFCRKTSNHTLYLAKIAMNGSVLWQRTMNLNEFSNGYDLSAFLLYQTYSQNTFYLYVNSIGSLNNISLIHFDSNGSIINESSTNTQIPQTISYQYGYSSHSENLKLFAYPDNGFDDTVILDVDTNETPQVKVSNISLYNKVDFSQFRSIGDIVIQIYNSTNNSYFYRLVNDNQIVNHSLLSTSDELGIAKKLDYYFDSESSLIYVSWIYQKSSGNELKINYCDDVFSYNDNGVKINTSNEIIIDQKIIEFQENLYVFWVKKLISNEYKLYSSKINKNTLEIENTILINSLQGINFNSFFFIKDLTTLKVLTNIDNQVFIQEIDTEGILLPETGELLINYGNIISVDNNIITVYNDNIYTIYTILDDNTLNFITEINSLNLFNNHIVCKDFNDSVLIMWIEFDFNNQIRYSIFDKNTQNLSNIFTLDNSLNSQDFYLMTYEDSITVCLKSDCLSIQKYKIINNQLVNQWVNQHIVNNSFNDYKIINVLMNSNYYNVLSIESNCFNNYVINNNGEFINSYFIDIVNLNENLEIFGIKKNDYTYAIICNPYSNYSSQVLVYNGISTYSRTSDISLTKYSLSNYPNPFNPSTTLSFELQKSSDVKLTVYNIKGQKVRDIFNGYLNSGNHEYVWDGTDQIGNTVSSGIYFTKIESANGIFVKKMMLIK